MDIPFYIINIQIFISFKAAQIKKTLISGFHSGSEDMTQGHGVGIRTIRRGKERIRPDTLKTHMAIRFRIKIPLFFFFFLTENTLMLILKP